MKPLISVVIPSCGRAGFLDACLRLLSPDNQAVDPRLYEVIVADDSRDHSTRKLIRENHPPVIWCKGPERGPAANRNRGASMASGSWIVFLDDDCEPSRGLLAAYHAAVTSGSGISVYEGRISALGRKRRIDQQAPINERGGVLWSCNLCINRELFRELGGFDENFPEASMEDVDLRERILAKGQRIAFLADAAVLHPWQPKKGVAFVKSHSESMVYFCTKHGRLEQLETKARLRILMHLLFNALVKEGWRYGWRGGIRFTGLSLYSVLALRRAARKGRRAMPSGLPHGE